MKKLNALLFALLFLGIRPANAQYTNLINFTGISGSYPGSEPTGDLTLSVTGDTLFGMTSTGGANNYGTIFSVHTDGTGYTDLIDFTGTSGPYPGGYPSGSLTLSGGVLYGMTSEEMLNGNGTIFSVHTDGTGYTDLIDFTGNSGSYPGEYPNGSLTLSVTGDTLFGMTLLGGANGVGTIFSVHTDGTGFTDLIDFTGTSGSYPGFGPNGDLTLSGGVLYGVTGEGTKNGGVGNIFSVHTDGTGYTDLIDFTGTSGSYPGDNPSRSLTLSGGVLYGMTGAVGFIGSSPANIFSVHTDGTSYTVLIDFTGTSGSYPGNTPYGSLTLSGGVLYGMTSTGGANEDGNIFSVHTDGTGYADLIDFTGSSVGSYPAENPFGSLTLSGGVLYGMTSTGGANEDGVIFKIDTSTLVTSINNLTVSKGAVNVYPNPNNGVFTLQAKSEELRAMSIEIYNVLGEKVYSIGYQPLAISHQPFTINLSNQPDGMYLYRAISNTGSLIGEGKMVIEK